MAQVVQTEEPAVVREERVEHIHDGAPARSNTGLVLAIILLILILLALFWWRPWGHSSTGSSGTNINVTTPKTSGSGQ